MSTYIIRLAAIVLIPCLITDPVTAAAFSARPSGATASNQTLKEFSISAIPAELAMSGKKLVSLRRAGSPIGYRNRAGRLARGTGNGFFARYKKSKQEKEIALRHWREIGKGKFRWVVGALRPDLTPEEREGLTHRLASKIELTNPFYSTAVTFLKHFLYGFMPLALLQGLFRLSLAPMGGRLPAMFWWLPVLIPGFIYASMQSVVHVRRIRAFDGYIPDLTMDYDKFKFTLLPSLFLRIYVNPSTMMQESDAEVGSLLIHEAVHFLNHSNMIPSDLLLPNAFEVVDFYQMSMRTDPTLIPSSSPEWPGQAEAFVMHGHSEGNVKAGVEAMRVALDHPNDPARFHLMAAELEVQPDDLVNFSASGDENYSMSARLGGMAVVLIERRGDAAGMDFLWLISQGKTAIEALQEIEKSKSLPPSALNPSPKSKWNSFLSAAPILSAIPIFSGSVYRAVGFTLLLPVAITVFLIVAGWMKNFVFHRLFNSSREPGGTDYTLPTDLLKWIRYSKMDPSQADLFTRIFREQSIHDQKTGLRLFRRFAAVFKGIRTASGLGIFGIFVSLIASLAYMSVLASETQKDGLAIWLLVGVSSVAVYVTFLVHELGHKLTAERLGYTVNSFVVRIIDNHMTLKEEAIRLRDLLLITAAGPLVSFVSSLGAFAAAVGLLMLHANPMTNPFVVFLLSFSLFSTVLAWSSLIFTDLTSPDPTDGLHILRSMLLYLIRQGDPSVFWPDNHSDDDPPPSNIHHPLPPKKPSTGMLLLLGAA